MHRAIGPPAQRRMRYTRKSERTPREKPRSARISKPFLSAGGSPPWVDDHILCSRGRLLIMDDDEAVRSAAAELLETIGFEAETAADGAEAIDLYSRALDSDRPFSAVVLDLTVPRGIGGRETIARLLEIDPQVKAIVSSGYSNDPVMANFREHGFSGVTAKPYRLAELARTLRLVLETE